MRHEIAPNPLSGKRGAAQFPAAARSHTVRQIPVASLAKPILQPPDPATRSRSAPTAAPSAWLCSPPFRRAHTNPTIPRSQVTCHHLAGRFHPCERGNGRAGKGRRARGPSRTGPDQRAAVPRRSQRRPRSSGCPSRAAARHRRACRGRRDLAAAAPAWLAVEDEVLCGLVNDGRADGRLRCLDGQGVTIAKSGSGLSVSDISRPRTAGSPLNPANVSGTNQLPRPVLTL